MPSFSFRLIAFSIHFPLTLSFLSPQLWPSKIAQAFLCFVLALSSCLVATCGCWSCLLFTR
ncbi:hypothetical protein F5H01DRAFT_348235 [Linnemannia elongata]|nr:hypothetical protein F5H01DRAFT_348235 [Linnemannia elongata]